MTKLGPQEIEERLTPPPAPEPPAGLAEKIKEEIPARPSAANDGARWRRRWLVAATVVVAAGAALLVQRTGREVDLLPAQAAEAPAAVAAQEDGPPGAVDEIGDEAFEAFVDAPPAPSAAAPSDDGDAAKESSAESTPSTAGARTGSDEGEPPTATGTTEEARRESRQRLRQGAPTPPASPGPPPAPVAEPPAAAPAEPEGDARVGQSNRHVDGADRAPERQAMRDELRQLQEAPKPRDAQPERRQKKVPIPDSTPDEPAGVITVTSEAPLLDAARVAPPPSPEPAPAPPPPSTGGSAEPNDQPYGDVFFDGYGTNPFIDTEDDPLSTFGLDVDTGSYTVVRRFLEDGHLPPPDAVRVEEMLNYFDYGDPAPEEGDFAIVAQAGPAPFADGPRYKLVRFHLAAREIAAEDRQPATLVFVVDVSGSMNRENRLGLVKRSLALLLDQLRSDDRVGLVVYGSSGQVLLEPTADLQAIRDAIGRLAAGGSTNAEEGLVLAYEQARRAYRPGAVHRLILCSDGVANVGRTGPDSILERIEREGRDGIELTTVGFGMGNYNDVVMEQLADRGNGRYAYVDDLDEARRIFVENLTGTLQTIAADAKVQVAFDPQVVSRYRLLGYENRDVADERFRDDTVDAGEIGAGHSVTALYEVKLAERVAKRASLATLTLRYRSAASGEIVESQSVIQVRELADSWEESPRELQLAAIVAELGEILRRSYWARESDLDDLFRRAQRLSGRYPGDLDVAELATLVGRAARLAPETR